MLREKEILMLFKGHNSVINLQKWTLNNPKLVVVSVNDYANFEQNPFFCSKDTEWKRNSDVIQEP